MNDKIKNAFSEIRADENLKSKTFEKVIASKAKKTIPLGYKLTPIMTMFTLFIFYNIYFTPVSFISIDINPSIELSINAFDRVVEVSSNNEDGEKIISSIDLKNLNYVEALEVLDDTESFADFTNSYTEITVISDNSDVMIASIESCSFNNQNMSFYSANMELKEQALENDISFGKYRAYLELLELRPNIEIEEITNLPMKVIREMIDDEGTLKEGMTPNGNDNQNGNNQDQGGGKFQNNGQENNKESYNGHSADFGNGNQSGKNN